MSKLIKFSRRDVLFGAAAIGTATLGTASIAFAETTFERAKAQGFIRIGFANEAPFGYATPDGKLTGEAPEVAKAVLAKMGIPQVDGVLTEFGSLIPGLKAGRFDIIAAGMFINPKRCNEIAKKGEGVESTKPFGEVAGKSVKGHGGFGFRKEDTDLYKAFNKELKAFIGTPEHLALVTPLGFGKDYLPNKTTEQLCKGE